MIIDVKKIIDKQEKVKAKKAWLGKRIEILKMKKDLVAEKKFLIYCATRFAVFQRLQAKLKDFQLLM